ncbi:hypothetical protein ERL59_20135 [Chengkuizengella sp. YPA3-1-1]|uniref:Uncharacterized protein n=1 Tax=Chengkuizengella marina TaxID=2507566 RepID=A0A6N9Q946_9BACL|nr:hypothetical protein [Chengkuizengella marina]
MPTDYQPYLLSYQLAEPIEEEVVVEGSVSLHEGGNHVEVGGGVVVREKANPDTPNTEYVYLNRTTVDSTLFKNKIDKILQIYRNGEIDDKWVFDTANSFGEESAYIPIELFDPTATYEVTYIAQSISTNPMDVNIQYETSAQSVQNALVTDMADVKTEQSILDRQIYNLLLVAKANGWEV